MQFNNLASDLALARESITFCIALGSGTTSSAQKVRRIFIACQANC